MIKYTTNLDSALDYATRGYPVLPLCWPTNEGACGCGRGHQDKNVGKAPLNSNGANGATTNPDVIRAWWTQWPEANIGIAVEAAGLLVIDQDSTEAEAEAQELGLPTAPTVRTGRGHQIWYKRPLDCPIKSMTHQGASRAIDIKASGYVIAPPSMHRSGQQYEWLRSLDDVALVPAPDWAVAMLGQPKAARPSAPRQYRVESQSLHEPPVRLSSSGLRRWRGEDCTRTPDGQVDRSESLYWVGVELAEAGASRGTIESALHARDTSLGWCKYAGRSDEALRYGEIADKAIDYASMERGVLRHHDGTEAFPLSDLGNAKRLIHEHGQDLRYWPTSKKWLVWDGQRWATDDTGEVMRRAKSTIEHMVQEAWALDENQRTRLIKHALKSQNVQPLTAMVKLAESEPRIPVLADALDADPMLLNVQNGTLDLRTGQLREHRRVDLITKLAPVAYDPHAQCPIWLAFLDRVMDGNESLITYLQQALGYCLTGDAGERILFMPYGDGANGKSTLLETVRAVLGDYALTTPQETLLQNGNQSIGNDVARLKGARFVSASETDAGQRFSESRVKQLTGGDTVVGRYLYGEHFEFKPQAKFWIATNHKPEIRGTDNGIWDRIALVPFVVRIPEDQRDKQLPTKLRAELPGILRWVVEGCLQWQRVGLVAPSEVRDATQGYRDEMDVVKKFLDDDCRLDSTKRTSLAELYAGFSKWADVSNERTITYREFNKRLRDRGFEDLRTSTTRSWEGIELIQRVPAAFPTSQDWPWGERVAS